MRRAALTMIAAAIGATGCGSLLGLDSFTDATSTGAGGTSQHGGGGSGGATGGGGGATGGSGGGGGGSIDFECTPTTGGFDILSPADLQSHRLDDERLVLVRESHRVYVAVVDEDDHTVVVRAVRADDPHTEGGPARSPVYTAPPRIYGGHFALNSVRVHGTERDNNGVETLGQHRFSFQNGSLSYAGFQATDTPDACRTAGGYIARVATTDVAGAMKCAMSCTDAANYRNLYLCGGVDKAKLVASSTKPEAPLLDPRGYAANGVWHAIYVGEDFGEAQGFRYGQQDALGTVHSFSLSDDPDELSTVFSVVSNRLNNGIVLLAATIKQPPALVPAHLYSGEVKATDFGTLQEVPPPALTLQQTITSLKEIALYATPSASELSLVAAGATPARDRVLMGYFTRQGKALILGQEIAVKKSEDQTFQQAGAAQLDEVTMLVAWIQKDDGGYSVRGQTLICSGSVD